MPATRVRRPKIEDLKLTPVQLAKAQDFVEDLGIGAKDPLYYYAILWCKNHEKSNGDFLTDNQRKKFDSDVSKKRRSALTLKILGEISLLQESDKDDKDRLQNNTPAANQQIRANTTRLRRQKTKPINLAPTLKITIDKSEVEKGESYTVSWKSENAITVSRSVGFFPKIPDVELSGSRSFVADRIGSKTFAITVRSSSGRGVLSTAKIQIVETKTLPDQQAAPASSQPRIKTARLTSSQGPTQVFVDINDSLTNIIKILDAQNKFLLKIRKKKTQEDENENRKKRESLLEKSKGFRKQVMEKAMAPVKNLLERIWKFIYLTFLGRVFTEFIKWASDPSNAGKIKSISRFFKDFWIWIAGAATIFFTPLFGLIKGTLGTLNFFSKVLLKVPIRNLLFNPTVLAIAGITGLAVAANEVTGQRKAAKLQTERAAKVQAGKAIDVPGIDIINEKYKTPGIGGRTERGFLKGASTGGIVTPSTGITVKGAGVDTQLVPIQDGGSVVLQKGEAILQKGARERMISSTGIDPLMFNIGANANRPRTIGSKLTAMSTGGIVGGKLDLIKPQARSILDRLIKGGLTPTAAAGVVSNIGVESAYTYDPNTHQHRGGPGRGLVQWEKGGRFDTDPMNLTSFAKSRGKPWNDLNTQVDFILHELNNHPEYSLVKDKINKAKNIGEATRIFLNDYEKAGTPHIENRLAVGNQLMKSGWLNPPKQKTKSQFPDILRMLTGQPRAVSAAESSKPSRTSTKPKPMPKPQSPQRSWWDPRRLMGLKKGGLIRASHPSVGSNPDDKHLALLKAGEYVIPRLTVQRVGLNFFDNLVAKTDENSNAARMLPIPKDDSILPPSPRMSNMGGFISLPPIANNMMDDKTNSPVTSVPSFGVIAPMGTGVRQMLAEIYGIG
jgi:hypothetical protein